MNLKSVTLPKRYSYIACFLTLNCNFNCDYCINWLGNDLQNKKHFMPGKKWIDGLNRLHCPSDLPVTLQGGEPSLHPDFIEIIKNIREDLNIDILTNLSFDVDKFVCAVKPFRLSRGAPYPNIRVSYHPQFSPLDVLIKKTLKMQEAGFSIGVYGILHPRFRKIVLDAQKKCLDLGIDFRTKEFLGEYNNILYGNYRYADAVHNGIKKKCLCRTSELLIGSDGRIFRCHHDVYKNFPSIGDLLDPDLEIRDVFRKCNEYGDCNACDIKIKTDRFQVDGYTAVEIEGINIGEEMLTSDIAEKR